MSMPACSAKKVPVSLVSDCRTGLCIVQPAALKTRPPQSFDDIRTASHQAPQKPCTIVFDHCHDWSLVEAIIAKRNPAFIIVLRIREGWIVAALETVLAGHLWKFPAEVMQRRQNDLGREGQRSHDCPRSKGPVIGSIGNAAPFVIVEPHPFFVDATHGRSWSVAGRDSPNKFAVPFITFWISHRVLLLGVGR